MEIFDKHIAGMHDLQYTMEFMAEQNVRQRTKQLP